MSVVSATATMSVKIIVGIHFIAVARVFAFLFIFLCRVCYSGDCFAEGGVIG